MTTLDPILLSGSKVTRATIPDGDDQIIFTPQGPSKQGTTLVFSIITGVTLEASASTDAAILGDPGAESPIWVDITTSLTGGILDLKFNLGAIRVTNGSGSDLDLDVR